MVHPVLSRAFAAAIVGVLACSGCSGGSDNSALPQDSDQLDVLLGRADPEVARRVLEQQATASQRSLAECMTERGFVYVPLPASAVYAPGPDASMSRAEFARTFGLGFLPLAGPNAPNLSLSGEDPNESAFASMTPSQQNAWADAVEECQLEADRETALLGITPAGWAVIDSFRARVEADQRMVDASKAWSDCMATSGLLYASPNAMRAHFQMVAEALVEDGAWDASSPRHTEYELAIDLEKQAAAGNLTCEDPYRQAEDAVIADLRADLIDDLRAEPSS